MNDNTQENTNSVVAWLALALAAFATVVAVVAFNRSGTNLGSVIEKETQEAAMEAEQAAEEASNETEDAIPDNVDVSVDVEEDAQ